MSNLFDEVGDFGDSIVGDIKAFVGISGADAAKEAAERQTAFGQEQLGHARDARQRLLETLAPFVGVGSSMTESPLFGDQAVSHIAQDPAFQAALQQQQQQLLASQAARGRLGTAETAGGLSSLSGQIASDFLSRQRGDTLGGIQLGQASAAQQASSGLGSGRQLADILTNIGNVQAAGSMGQAQAGAQGAQNVIGLATTLGSIFASERRLKRNIKLTGIRPDGVSIYQYQYIGSDKIYIGAMVDENPHAVVDCGDYKAINYARL